METCDEISRNVMEVLQACENTGELHQVLEDVKV
jgi:type II secretory pathway component PulF